MSECPEQYICDILQLLMSKHCHGKKDLPRDAVCNLADKDADRDTLATSVDLAVDRLRSVEERPGEKYALQHTEELVDYLVEECNREPEFFKAYLNHVPPYVWRKYDVTPPKP